MYKHSKPWREFPLESPYTYLRNGLVTPDMYLIHIYIYKIYITLTIALKLLSIHPVKSFFPKYTEEFPKQNTPHSHSNHIQTI